MKDFIEPTVSDTNQFFYIKFPNLAEEKQRILRKSTVRPTLDNIFSSVRGQVASM